MSEIPMHNTTGESKWQRERRLKEATKKRANLHRISKGNPHLAKESATSIASPKCVRIQSPLNSSFDNPINSIRQIAFH